MTPTYYLLQPKDFPVPYGVFCIATIDIFGRPMLHYAETSDWCDRHIADAQAQKLNKDTKWDFPWNVRLREPSC